MTLINCGLVKNDGDVSNELKSNITESHRDVVCDSQGRICDTILLLCWGV